MNEPTKLIHSLPAADDGAVQRFLVGLFGRSYRTSIAGVLAAVSGGIVAISTAMPNTIPHTVVAIAAALSPILAGAGLMAAKDSRISGLPR